MRSPLTLTYRSILGISTWICNMRREFFPKPLFAVLCNNVGLSCVMIEYLMQLWKFSLFSIDILPHELDDTIVVLYIDRAMYRYATS